MDSSLTVAGRARSGDLGTEAGGRGEPQAPDSPPDAGWGGDGVAVGERGLLEVGPAEADGGGGGEVNDGAAGGGVDQADIAGTARGHPVSAGAADAAGSRHDAVARGQFEVAGGDTGPGELAGGAKCGAGEEVELAGFGPRGGEEDEFVGGSPLAGPGVEDGGPCGAGWAISVEVGRQDRVGSEG